MKTPCKNETYLGIIDIPQDPMAVTRFGESHYRKEDGQAAGDSISNTHSFYYDPNGNRTVKEHLGGEAVWVNGTKAGVKTDSMEYSIYPSPYISITGNRWTKHYYIGSERIASRTGTFGDFAALHTPDNQSAGNGQVVSVNYAAIRQAEEDSIASFYAQLGVPSEVQRNTRGSGVHLYLPTSLPDDNRSNSTANEGTTGERDRDSLRNTPTTLDGGQVYYYHRDPLGSTLSVSDSVGTLVQQVEYTPWGEVFVELRGDSTFTTPYLFNGKELDEETGLYYYGARYYDPKLCVWYSSDPMEMDYPWVSTYGYCLGNPINAIDSYGKEVVWNIWNGSHSKIVKALNQTNTYNTIFYRFLKNQDNVFIMPSNDLFWGYANPKRMSNGYSIQIGNNGFVKNGLLVADPTMIAKVIMHEGLHAKYSLVYKDDNLSSYPTLYKHMQNQYIMRGYQGEHQAMGEGNITTLVQGMKEFDKYYGTSHSDDWYNAMAWWGSLMSASDVWFNLDNKVRNNYMLIQQNEERYMHYLDAKATYYGHKTKENMNSMNRAKQSVDWNLFKKTRNE